jgi:hypothetical protein
VLVVVVMDVVVAPSDVEDVVVAPRDVDVVAVAFVDVEDGVVDPPSA